MKVASAIYQQLGGNRFSVMTGAKGFIASENGLTFRIPKSNQINAVRITLNGFDLYDVEFIKIHGMKVTTVKTIDNLYVDNLVEVFENTTGLYTKF
jgi:hypothetical protein